MESNRSLSTVWKKIEASGFKFYCVSCTRQRFLSPPAKIGSAKFVAHILITTAFLAVLAWPWLHWKGAAFFVVPVGFVFEAIYRMKMRAALVCPDCGFDPILYLVNRKEAVRQVEESWKKKFEEKGFAYKKRLKNQRRPREQTPRSSSALDVKSDQS